MRVWRQLMGMTVPVLAIVACGTDTFSDGDSGASPDASAEDGALDSAAGDAMMDGGLDAVSGLDGNGPACDLKKPFGAPTVLHYGGRVAGTTDDNTASLSADELTLYFATDQSSPIGGHPSIYAAARPTTLVDFGPIGLVATVNFTPVEYDPVISTDGLRLYFTAQPTGPLSIEVAKRTSTMAAFAPPAAVSGLSASASNSDAWVSADGATIYFTSNAAGNDDIYTAALATGDTASGVTQLFELNSLSADRNPVVSADGLTVFFNSLRSPSADGDIYVARRTTPAAVFGAAVPVTELNSPYNDYPTWLSSDGCRIILGSYRQDFDGAIGNVVVYQATRPK